MCYCLCEYFEVLKSFLKRAFDFCQYFIGNILGCIKSIFGFNDRIICWGFQSSSKTLQKILLMILAPRVRSKYRQSALKAYRQTFDMFHSTKIRCV